MALLSATAFAAQGKTDKDADARLAAAVEEAARQHLEAQADRAGWGEPAFELNVVESSSSRRTEPCTQEVAVESVDTRYATRLRFAAVCPGASGWRREFIVRSRVTAQVVVAAAEVPVGRPIVRDDLALEARDVSATPDAVGDPEQAIGLTVKRTLRAGQLLSKKVLLTPLMVTRGQRVTIAARNGNIEVNVAGEALEDGREHEVVRVRNASSGKVIRARVMADGVVQPESMPGPVPPAQSR